MNGYELSRDWFDFCFENPQKIKPNHTALFFFAVEQCNRLGWKENFGLPTSLAMEAIGIKAYNTYSQTLKDIVDWGFFKMVEKSKNQYSANIIALSKFDKALDKALDKAFIKHDTKHTTKQSESTLQSTCQSIDSIIKQITIEPINNLTNKQYDTLSAYINSREDKDSKKFNFKKSFKKVGVSEGNISDWIKARTKKRATNSEVSFNKAIKEMKKAVDLGYTFDYCVQVGAENSWSGWKYEWFVKVADPIVTIKQREARLRDQIIQLKSDNPEFDQSDILNSFWDHWTVVNTATGKMRYEEEEYFDLKVKLKNWFRNNKEGDNDSLMSFSDMNERKSKLIKDLTDGRSENKGYIGN